ncbi:hypothetical protein BASA81_001129 [Batrachochytrium salamandrivorans]|nr:hypothetical protein BASA81_001129 [Batrachochytrium salamandrivorans]
MSDDDWEDAPVPAPAVSANKFKDEVETVVLDGPKSTSASAVSSKSAGVSKAQLKVQEAEALERASRPMTAEEKREEALRVRRAVEEADHELSDALFGNKPKASAAPVAAPVVTAKKAAAATANAANLQDLKGLTEFFATVPLTNTNQAKNAAVALGKKVSAAKKDAHLMFIKELLKECCEVLTDNDVNELTGVLSVIKNEKVKAKFAKKTVARPNLNTRGLDKDGGERDDHDNYDDYYDEGDFM